MGRPRKYSDVLSRRAIDEVLERDRKVPDVADVGEGLAVEELAPQRLVERLGATPRRHVQRF